MQKIQFYLVPNRITVTTDVAGYNTEYRQVYQRNIKIYKGIDNTLEFDVRNSQNRKETSVANYDLIVKLFDASHQLLLEVTGTPVLSSPGLMSVTFSKADLALIDAQQLQIAALLQDPEDADIQKLLYVDSQFGLFGNVELLDGYNTKLEPGSVIQEVNVFNFEFDKMAYTSEYIAFGTELNDDVSALSRSVEIELIVKPSDPYRGTVKVQATKAISTALGNKWIDIDTIAVEAEDVTKVITNTDNYSYLRLVYNRFNAASGAQFAITALSDNTYSVVLRKKGNDYVVGDVLTVKGLSMYGDDGTNDVVITITDVNTDGSIKLDGFTHTGTSIYYEPNKTVIAIPLMSRLTGMIDKAIVRN